MNQAASVDGSFLQVFVMRGVFFLTILIILIT